MKELFSIEEITKTSFKKVDEYLEGKTFEEAIFYKLKNSKIVWIKNCKLLSIIALFWELKYEI